LRKDFARAPKLKEVGSSKQYDDMTDVYSNKQVFILSWHNPRSLT
jgi:hypothetical protein